MVFEFPKAIKLVVILIVPTVPVVVIKESDDIFVEYNVLSIVQPPAIYKDPFVLEFESTVLNICIESDNNVPLVDNPE